MTKALPDITIKISEDANCFLQNIEEILRKSSVLSGVKLEIDYLLEGHSILCAVPVEQNGNIYLWGQLIFHQDKRHRINIEVRARQWENEWPTKEQYIEWAYNIFKKPLAAYNKLHSKRYRITVHSRKANAYKLPPGAQKFFDRFTIFPDIGISHPLERENFHKFIKYCHQFRVKLDGNQLETLLKRKGFSEEKAEELSQIYVHGRELLKIWI